MRFPLQRAPEDDTLGVGSALRCVDGADLTASEQRVASGDADRLLDGLVAGQSLDFRCELREVNGSEAPVKGAVTRRPVFLAPLFVDVRADLICVGR